ncbi:hypothetical protein BaRGS_00037955, partial [Batillaria attramentaria]
MLYFKLLTLDCTPINQKTPTHGVRRYVRAGIIAGHDNTASAQSRLSYKSPPDRVHCTLHVGVWRSWENKKIIDSCFTGIPMAAVNSASPGLNLRRRYYL